MEAGTGVYVKSRKNVSARNRIWCASRTAPELVYRVKCVPLSGICSLRLSNEMLASQQCDYIFTDICADSRGHGVCVAQTGIEGQITSGAWRQYLGVFAKFRKATIIFVMSVCLSVWLTALTHETTWLPLDGFSWNFIFVDVSKNVDKIRVVLKPDKNNRYLCVLCTFMIISSWILLGIRSILGKTL